VCVAARPHHCEVSQTLRELPPCATASEPADKGFTPQPPSTTTASYGVWIQKDWSPSWRNHGGLW
jgi:hypothetical protein